LVLLLGKKRQILELTRWENRFLSTRLFHRYQSAQTLKAVQDQGQPCLNVTPCTITTASPVFAGPSVCRMVGSAHQNRSWCCDRECLGHWSRRGIPTLRDTSPSRTCRHRRTASRE